MSKTTEKVCPTCKRIFKDRHSTCQRCRYRTRVYGDPLATPKGRTPKKGPRCSHHGCLKYAEDGQKECRVHLADPSAKVSHVFGEQVPIEPLLSYVNARGGLAEVMDEAGLHNRGREYRPREAMRKMFDRAVLRGSISVYSADQIIVTLFRQHPVTVYGESWWTTEPEAAEETEQVAA